jgi:ribosome-associated protein
MKFTETQKKQLETELILSASRSSGPGGQNVNKVNSRVELRFSVKNTSLFTDEEKELIFLKLKTRINLEGEIIFTSQAARTQLDNREKVIQKFFEVVEKALTVRKKRIKSEPTAASKEKRLEAKKNTGQKKLLRRLPEI